MSSLAHPVGESLTQTSLGPRPHPRTIGWFGTTAVAMGGINQSLFLISALFIGQGDISGQGSAAVPLLIVGLLLSWAATPGWLELIMMYPNRVGGISATCAEAFRPYSPVLANLTGVCYWWGWVPTCGLTALLAASALNSFYLPELPVPLLATYIVLFFTVINLCGVKWAMRAAMPIATISAGLAFLSAVLPIVSGAVDWHQAFSFRLTVPFDGWFGQLTSVMAGLYLIGFAAPAFEQATSHVGETRDPERNVPRAVFLSAGLAGLYFVVLPIVWLGALGPEPLGEELALVLGPTFAPLFGAGARAAAIWFMVFNMLHGTLAPLAGAARVLSQLAEDGLLPEFMARRSRTDAPWVTTLLTAAMAILFLFAGDPVWLIAAANLTYLIGIALPSVAVWLLRRNEPGLHRPYRAPRGWIMLGLLAAAAWGVTVVLGFQQFGLRTVIIGICFAYAGSALYAWRKFSDRRKAGLPGIGRTLHIKLTGAMLLVLVLDGVGYLIAVDHVPRQDLALIALLEDIFVVVALLTIAVGLILPGMIAHSAVEVSKAADKLVHGTLADFTRAMRALAAGDLEAAKAHFDMVPLVVHTQDEVGDMAINFNRLQDEIGRAAAGLEGAREGLSQARTDLTESNARLRHELAERERDQAELRAAHAELEERNRELLTYSYSISHDLRTPLRGIDGWSQAVLEDYGDRLDEQGQSYLNWVRLEAQRMGRLIDALLNLSRLMQLELNMESVDLSALAEAGLARLRQEQPERRVELIVAPGMRVVGDVELLRAALGNLLENAWQYTKTREVARIEVGQIAGETGPVYFVRDNGVGFDMAYAQKLFAPFQRLHKQSEFPGTGIGLANVLRIIRRHGGTVRAEAEVDRGATFYFTLNGETRGADGSGGGSTSGAELAVAAGER